MLFCGRQLVALFLLYDGVFLGERSCRLDNLLFIIDIKRVRDYGRLSFYVAERDCTVSFKVLAALFFKALIQLFNKRSSALSRRILLYGCIFLVLFIVNLLRDVCFCRRDSL